MSNIGKGFAAGLAATIVLSLLMVMKSMMGIMPGLDIAKMIAGMMGAPDQPIIGWTVHFMIGVLGYGAAIALLDTRLPGRTHLGHGLLLGVVGWLIMMIMLMPLAGAALFGMAFGVMAPMMTLVLHLIFGAVLGWTYGLLLSEPRGGRHAAA